MPTYKPQLALVTGATGDFGRAFVRELAALGTRLVLCGRNPDKLSALAATLPVECHHLVFDMRDIAAMEAAIKSLPPAFTDIDLLINNAGLALGAAPAHQAPLSDWTEMIETNCRGVAALTHFILPGMVERGRGHIINIGSTAGSYPYPGGHVYCASKAFVKQFSLALRADLCQTPVRVTNIEPGMVETQFSTVRFHGDTTKAAAVYAGTTPLQPDDVADALIWAATRPLHANINRIELMPTTQGPGPLQVKRS